MKHIAKLFALLLLILIMTGCGENKNGADRVNTGNSIDKVINEQIANAETQKEDASVEKSDTETTDEAESPKEQSGKISGEVDYDLTAMSNDMVYATVYQMMIDPDAYIGKTIRMNGLYYASYYEKTAQYYHYCIIKDALACCTQGMEFVWDDGSHSYPDEYPVENAEIVVQGIFETYQEEGDTNLYCRLKNCSLEVIKSGS